MKKVLYILFLLPFLTFAQKDTNTLHGTSEEVIIIRKIDRIDHPSINIDKESIERISGNSLGDALRSTPGIQIKDYGGIGGLQSISVRSLGANHSGVLRNGVLLNGGSTGQINLSTIPINAVESLRFDIGQSDQFLLPASAYRFANITTINTKTFKKDTSKFSFTSLFGYGSFATLEGNIGFKSSFKKGFVALNANYLNSKGNYPYQIPNSGNDNVYARDHAKIHRYEIDIAGGFDSKIGKTRLDYVRNYSRQELPGAVVLWVFKNDQYLDLITDQVSLSHFYKKDRWTINISSNYQYQQTNYTDSIVFNSQGYISDQYYFSKIQNDVSTKYYFKNNYSMYGGASYNRSWLNATNSYLENPVRNEIFGLIGFKKIFVRTPMKLEVNALIQHIDDVRSSVNKKKITRINPYASFAINPWVKTDFRIRLFYKFSNRLPSFNEIYYSQIGNLDLDPEDAHQFNFGLTYQTKPNNWLKQLIVRADVYHNIVQNKIVAIPTKDLFIWSIQNVEKASITGLDFQLTSSIQFAKKSFVNLMGSYSFQNALNKTDEEHITYNNQIAYIPKHQFNTSIELSSFGAFIKWNSHYNGKRYHLNENNAFNELQSYWINDLIIGYNYQIKKSKIKFIFSINNIANQQFEAIRSFPMLGRNYKLKLIYEFN